MKITVFAQSLSQKSRSPLSKYLKLSDSKNDTRKQTWKAENVSVFGQLPDNRKAGKRPSYLMEKAGNWSEDHCQLYRFS